MPVRFPGSFHTKVVARLANLAPSSIRLKLDVGVISFKLESEIIAPVSWTSFVQDSYIRLIKAIKNLIEFFIIIFYKIKS